MRMVDRAGIIVRDHQRELVMIALVGETRSILPAVPYSAQGFHILAHAWDWGDLFDTPSPCQMRFCLSAQTKLKSTIRERLNCPGVVGSSHWTAWECDKDPSQQIDLRCVNCRCGRRKCWGNGKFQHRDAVVSQIFRSLRLFREIF